MGKTSIDYLYPLSTHRLLCDRQTREQKIYITTLNPKYQEEVSPRESKKVHVKVRSWTKVRTTLCLARDKLNVGETNLFYHVLYCCAKNTPAHSAKKLPPFFCPSNSTTKSDGEAVFRNKRIPDYYS